MALIEGTFGKHRAEQPQKLHEVSSKQDFTHPQNSRTPSGCIEKPTVLLMYTKYEKKTIGYYPVTRKPIDKSVRN